MCITTVMSTPTSDVIAHNDIGVGKSPSVDACRTSHDSKSRKVDLVDHHKICAIIVDIPEEQLR